MRLASKLLQWDWHIDNIWCYLSECDHMWLWTVCYDIEISVPILRIKIWIRWLFATQINHVIRLGSSTVTTFELNANILSLLFINIFENEFPKKQKSFFFLSIFVKCFVSYFFCSAKFYTSQFMIICVTKCTQVAHFVRRDKQQRRKKTETRAWKDRHGQSSILNETV